MAGLKENAYEAPDRGKRERGGTYIVPDSSPTAVPGYMTPMTANRIQPGVGWRKWVGNTIRPPMDVPLPRRYGSTDQGNASEKAKNGKFSKTVVVTIQKVVLAVILVGIIASIVTCFMLLMEVMNKHAVRSPETMKCLASGGECKNINAERCDGGVFLSGMCPGKSNIKCCMESTRCSEQDGKCQDRNTLCVAGKYKANICPGPSNIQCCIRNGRCTRNKGTCSNVREKICKGGVYIPGSEYCPGKPDVQCCFSSYACTRLGGKCQDKNATTCNGVYKRMLCPGPNEIQCCRSA